MPGCGASFRVSSRIVRGDADRWVLVIRWDLSVVVLDGGGGLWDGDSGV